MSPGAMTPLLQTTRASFASGAVSQLSPTQTIFPVSVENRTSPSQNTLSGEMTVPLRRTNLVVPAASVHGANVAAQTSLAGGAVSPIIPVSVDESVTVSSIEESVVVVSVVDESIVDESRSGLLVTPSSEEQATRARARSARR